MIARLLALVFALCFTTAAKADVPWTATGSTCVPADATIKFDRDKVNTASVQHAAGNVDLIVLNCPITPFASASLQWVLQMTYQDSTGNSAAQAFVRALLYRMQVGSATPELLVAANSNSRPNTTLNLMGSPSFPHTFNFSGFAYWVRVELERATTSQTVIFHSVNLADVAISDIRAKHGIVLLGHLDNGLGFYRFSYNGSDAAYVGVMAQEVEALMPDAVVRGSDDYLRVDYGRLGLRMQTWDDWVAAGEKIPATSR